MNERIAEFPSDKVLISGPRVDGSYRVTFEVGEYGLEEIKPLISVRDRLMQVTVSDAG